MSKLVNQPHRKSLPARTLAERPGRRFLAWQSCDAGVSGMTSDYPNAGHPAYGEAELLGLPAVLRRVAAVGRAIGPPAAALLPSSARLEGTGHRPRSESPSSPLP